MAFRFENCAVFGLALLWALATGCHPELASVAPPCSEQGAC